MRLWPVLIAGALLAGCGIEEHLAFERPAPDDTLGPDIRVNVRPMTISPADKLKWAAETASYASLPEDEAALRSRKAELEAALKAGHPDVARLRAELAQVYAALEALPPTPSNTVIRSSATSSSTRKTTSNQSTRKAVTKKRASSASKKKREAKGSDKPKVKPQKKEEKKGFEELTPEQRRKIIEGG